jgi:hypothetical protein
MGRYSSEPGHHLRLLGWLFGAVLLLWVLAALVPVVEGLWERVAG